MSKVKLFVISTVLFSLSVIPVLALDFGLNYGTYTGLGTQDIREGVMTIVSVLLGFLGIIAITGIVFGGFLMMTSGGNEEKNAGGKKAITAGIIGLVVIFTAYAISIFVITQLITATGATY